MLGWLFKKKASVSINPTPPLGEWNEHVAAQRMLQDPQRVRLADLVPDSSRQPSYEERSDEERREREALAIRLHATPSRPTNRSQRVPRVYCEEEIAARSIARQRDLECMHSARK